MAGYYSLMFLFIHSLLSKNPSLQNITQLALILVLLNPYMVCKKAAIANSVDPDQLASENAN